MFNSVRDRVLLIECMVGQRACRAAHSHYENFNNKKLKKKNNSYLISVIIYSNFICKEDICYFK